MKIASLMVGSTVSIVLLVGGAQAQYGAPWLATIDEFNQGGNSASYAWPTSIASQWDVGGLNVIGGRRVASAGFNVANTTPFGTSLGSMSINTTAGTWNLSATPVATNSIFLSGYRGTAVPNVSNLMQNLNFPGIHGVGIDFISLSAPIPVEIQLVTLTGQTGSAAAYWRGTIQPSSDGSPFRFRTTWDQYQGISSINLNQVDQIVVSFRPTPGISTSAVIDSIGVAPSPGAAGLLGMGLVAATRRRRTA